MGLGKVEVLRRRVQRKLARTRKLLSVQLADTSQAGDTLVADIAINTFNLWAEFSRDYFRIALSRGKTQGGAILSTRFPKGTSLEDALRQMPSGVLRRKVGPQGKIERLAEPPWHSRKILLQVSREVQLSLLAQVHAALALPVSFVDDLVVARNFFAHRNEETARKVRLLGAQYSILGIGHPCELILGVAPGRPSRIIEDWLGEMEMVVDLMCE